MRLLVYTDYVYRLDRGSVHGDRAFVRFLGAVASRFEGATVIGRLDPSPGPVRYRLPDEVAFVPLPHYETLAQPIAAARTIPPALVRMWRASGGADVVWALGPQPHAIALAIVARLRRRRLVLGVRQDFPAYVRHHRPGRRGLHLTARLLEAWWRMLARRAPVVAVGSELAVRYRHAPETLAATVSLIGADDVRRGAAAFAERPYDGPLQLLSVGRLDGEKDPLLVAEAFARLHGRDPRWRLRVCGEGPLAGALAARLESLGLAAHARLDGYVPLDHGLLEHYRRSHALINASRTEGMPQVLIEALASGLPTVATAVGGVPDLADAVLLVPPGDAEAAAEALQRIAADRATRERLVAAGLERAAALTVDESARRVAAFLAAA